MDIGKIKESEIVTEMQKSYLDYAMSVIVSRALPDIRDGLKPVHRRILFAMHQINLTYSARFSKSAKVVGEVLGKYHPHGDSPVYESLVRMAQTFSMRYPLIKGQGNFGSIDGDPPAAMRYTECKLDRISSELLIDIEKETVDFIDNFDGSLKEPVFLPAKLPNLLLMGSEGIAVGMATKIPPHNISEVIDALNLMIEKTKIIKQNENTKKTNNSYNYEFDVVLEDLLEHIKGPDFPTAGAIYDIEQIKLAYSTGKGKIVIRGIAEIEDVGQGKSSIIITELPYQVNKAHMVAKIADLVKSKKIDGISDLRDESDRRGIRVVVELKRDAVPKKVLNNLYKFTNLQTSFPANMVTLVNGTPQTVTLKKILEEYIKHRHLVIKKRSEYELKQARAREHILLGLKIAVDHIDEVIALIKKSKDADTAKNKLIKRYRLTEIQATAILDMQLRRLAALERQKIVDELAMIQETIAYLEDLLAHPKKMLAVIKNELNKLREKYGDDRKTKVFKSKAGEFSDEQLIPNEKTLITISKSGYIKRVPRGTYKVQERGGKGVIGMTTKDEEDAIDKIFSSQTHDYMLFFTDRGRVYQIRVWDIPETSRQSKGQAVINLINIEASEKVTSILIYGQKAKKTEYDFIFMATEKGTVKKTKLTEYLKIRRSGLIAIKLNPQDKLVEAKTGNSGDNTLLVTHNGKSIRFAEKEIRATARDTMGVRGIRLKEDDRVIAMQIINNEIKNDNLLTIMEKGIGKKTKLSEFPKQRRGGQGVKVAQVRDKTGRIAISQLIPQKTKYVVLSSGKGQIVKLPEASIPRIGRATSGVILMRFSKKNDHIAAATCLTK